MHSDPIADMLARIKNTLSSWKKELNIPFSTIKEGILEVFVKHKFIESYSINKDTKFKSIDIKLSKDKEISNIKKVSKPGCRIYTSGKDIKPVLRWYWISIISTSKWFMAWYEAYKQWIWWEIICEIY